MHVMRSPSSLFLTLFLLGLVACSGGQDQEYQAEAEVEAGAKVERYRAVVVPEGLTWQDAKERAEADGGHLVTIASAEENAVVHALIAENPEIWYNLDVMAPGEDGEAGLQVTLGPWIGLYQPAGSPEPAGGWTWITGEALDYSNWFTQPDAEELDEPNDMGGIEQFGNFFGQGVDSRADTWNDMPNDVADFAEGGVEFVGEVHNPRGYIVEFE